MTYSITPLEDEFENYCLMNDITNIAEKMEARLVFMAGATTFWMMVQNRRFADNTVDEIEAHIARYSGPRGVNPYKDKLI